MYIIHYVRVIRVFLYTCILNIQTFFSEKSSINFVVELISGLGFINILNYNTFLCTWFRDTNVQILIRYQYCDLKQNIFIRFICKYTPVIIKLSAQFDVSTIFISIQRIYFFDWNHFHISFIRGIYQIEYI